MNIEMLLKSTKGMHSTKEARSLNIKTEEKSPAFIELLSNPTMEEDGEPVTIGIFKKRDIENMSICLADVGQYSPYLDIEIDCKITGKSISFHTDEGQDLLQIWDGVNATDVKISDFIAAINAICFRRSKKGL